MDRGAWQAIVDGIAKSWTRLSQTRVEGEDLRLYDVGSVTKMPNGYMVLKEGCPVVSACSPWKSDFETELSIQDGLLGINAPGKRDRVRTGQKDMLNCHILTAKP